MGLELLQKVRKDKKKGSKPSTQKNNPESESMQCTDILLWFNPSQQFRPCSCKTALCQLPVLTACWHHLYAALLTPAEGWRAKRQVNQVIDWFDCFFFSCGMQVGTNSRHKKKFTGLQRKIQFFILSYSLLCLTHQSLHLQTHSFKPFSLSNLSNHFFLLFWYILPIPH